MPRITFDNWQQGTAKSPHLGTQELSNVAIFNPRGELRAGYKATLNSDATVDGLVRWFFYDPDEQYLYGLADNGDLYRNTGFAGATTDWDAVSGVSTSNASGNGFAVWKGYALLARDTNLDYASTGSITSWTTGWQTLTSDDSHQILVSEDDKVYVANNKSISRLVEDTTFNPSDSGTYSWSTAIATIADDVSIKVLADYTKRYIVAGVEMPDGKAALYFYDRTTQLFEERILLDEYGIGTVVVDGTTLIVQAGKLGAIYVGNLSGLQKATEMEFLTTSSLPKPPLVTAQYGAGVTTAGEVLLGIGMTDSNMVAGSVYPLGVYGLKDGAVYLKNTISTGATGSGEVVQIGAIKQVGNTNDYFISWKDDSSYGIDRVGSGGTSTNYTPAYISQYLSLGDKRNPYEFQFVEFHCAAALGNDDGVRLEYRRELDDNWTTVNTWTGSTTGNAKSFDDSLPIGDVTEIQFRISLRGNTRLKRVVVQ